MKWIYTLKTLSYDNKHYGLLGFTVADGMQHISQLRYAKLLDSK